MDEVVLGIDVGTQGVRILAVDPTGRVIASAESALPAASTGLPPGWFEQSPQSWWQGVQEGLRQILGQLSPGTQVAGISVDSTSGTILPVDAAGQPLHPALMYNDQRSEPQVAQVQEAGAAHQARFGYKFGSSYALPKIVWFAQERPQIFAQTHRFIHAADYINGCLTGNFGLSDTSNALKTGFDLLELRWPDFIERDLGIPLERLPEVVLPGACIGHVFPQAAELTGLAPGIAVLAGATDGTAAQFASGAALPGEWNSTLGTTLVIKGMTRELSPDPAGRVYFHRHPEGWWMPGGASNTGTEWILKDHPGEDLRTLDQEAAAFLPTALVRYPLAKKGERFPFIHGGAQGFLSGEDASHPASRSERYAAGLEGLALLERLAYDTLDSIGLEVGDKIYITGGGSRSLVWSQIRATVLRRTLVQPEVAETALGTAIIAASGCWYATISQAAQQMLRIARVIEPNPDWQAAYNDRYTLFVNELIQRGYLTGAV